MEVANVSLITDGYIWTVCVKDAKVAGIAADGSLVENVGVKRGDFWDFLSKLELFRWLIFYKVKSSFFSHAIISAFVHYVGFSLSNILYKDLTIVYFCCLCIYMLYFCK